MEIMNCRNAITGIALVIGILMVDSKLAAQDQAPPAPPVGKNHLGETTSPYLLQHAQNPVHWYPWGEEAFEAARAQNKPIFLSIGYSTCYWCHVMERESFENQEVADVLNAYFIAVKVDREERPDVDEIYMTAVQMITRGRGGWPISLFLEPEKLQPFYGGTYFPKNDNGGRRGFVTTMNFIHDKWENENDSVMKQAALVGSAVTNRLTTKQKSVPLNSEVIQQGISSLLTRYDSVHGGFSSSPKFPMPSYTDFLLDAGWDIPQVRTAVTNTLDKMFMGGMYDQVGGGFHRYSTDEKWLVPHFEKMLYDNGQLVTTYAEAYKKTGNPTYAKIVEETMEYVDRELSAPDGGFLSAQDAESNHLEGETYLWRTAELSEALTQAGMQDEIEFALSIYGVDQGTNFRDPHHSEVPPTNVLYLVDHPDKLASKHGMTYEEFQQRVDAIDAALLKVRDTRDQPTTDDKIITAWNGMMIAGAADAGRILKNPDWVARAERAATFILDEMQLPSGKLLRTWRNGKGGAEAFLIDYSALIKGLLAIYKANVSGEALLQAEQLYATAKTLFYVEGEGWYDTEEGQSDLFVRTRAQSDGAMPAATSLIFRDLISLAELTGKTTYLSDALATLDSESQLIQSVPLAAIVATTGLHKLIQTYPEKFDEEFELALDESSPVRMSVEPSKVLIPAGESGTIQVQLRLAKGWHVNTNTPGNEYAIPLSFASLDQNVSLKVDWPEGESVVSAGEQVEVYGGSVRLNITLTANKAAKGNIPLTVTWQACDVDSCLAQKTTRIPCEIIVE
ncbi:MAG: DUF255 domain-containing protein [Phycisphaerae bacterium]|jgi:uncharacterized protein|nr:DUF255 domain-containing protein [Phycisphaerae bacterium]